MFNFASSLAVPDISHVAAIVPAYNPGDELAPLIGQLLDAGFGRIVVVDDGSGLASAAVFSRLPNSPRLILLRHAVNCGKGRALKTAFNHCLSQHPDFFGVVTADADGQHRADDVVRVAAELLAQDTPVLGVRQFDRGVPLRSRLGNIVTRRVFALLYGRSISDTQTGLRGFPLRELVWLITAEGERYEYEFSVLASAIARRLPVHELSIATIYRDGNRSSHFNPLLDSMRIYFVLIRFFASSLLAAGIDFIAFAIVFSLGGNTLIALISGRGCALSANFLLNKKFVFHYRRGGKAVFLRYCALVVLLAAISYLMILKLQSLLDMGALTAKLIAESFLFVLSFALQREVVFADYRQEQKADGRD